MFALLPSEQPVTRREKEQNKSNSLFIPYQFSLHTDFNFRCVCFGRFIRFLKSMRLSNWKANCTPHSVTTHINLNSLFTPFVIFEKEKKINLFELYIWLCLFCLAYYKMILTIKWFLLFSIPSMFRINHFSGFCSATKVLTYVEEILFVIRLGVNTRINLSAWFKNNRRMSHRLV